MDEYQVREAVDYIKKINSIEGMDSEFSIEKAMRSTNTLLALAEAWLALDVSEDDIVKIISKIGATWMISSQDVGRELLVIPMGEEAFKVIARAIVNHITKGKR